ncbi:hypothetical protein PMAYCL1PPCAC_18799, partial [Pristionchus mayeri]
RSEWQSRGCRGVGGNCEMKPKMARKPRPTDEVNSPPLSPTSGRLVHKKRRIESESVSPDRKMSTSSTCDKGPKSPKFSSPKDAVSKESKVPKPLSPLPPLLLDDQQPCSSLAPVTAIHAPPEFLAFNYKLHCPTLQAAIKADEPLPHIKSDMLRDLQHELESMLAHTMDFMRRAAGDLQFLETGEYSMVNLKKREMPVYQMRVLASPLSPTTQVHHEISLRSLVVPSIAPDDDVDVWPPPHLGTRYQSWLMMEKTERSIDKETLDQFDKFINNEMNELDMEYVEVEVAEFRHRLHYSSSLEMFSSFERRLHDHALQLQQLQIDQREGTRVLHNNCAKSSSWWTHPLASLGAAEAFSKTYRSKYDTFVSERRVKMMKINMLPSLRYQSFEDKQVSEREEALLEENMRLKEELKEARQSMEKDVKEKRELKKKEEQREKNKTPSTLSKSSKKKSDGVSEMPSSSKSSFKPTTPSKVTPSTSRDEEKTMKPRKELSKETIGGARFVMVVEDERGRRRVVPLAENGEWIEEEEVCKEREFILNGGDLHQPLHINLPSITNRFERRSAREESKSQWRKTAAPSRSRAHSLARLRHLAIAGGRSKSAPPPPREKYSMEMMKKGAKRIEERYSLRGCRSVRTLTLKEATKGILSRKEEIEGEMGSIAMDLAMFSPSKKLAPLLISSRNTSPLKKSPLKKADKRPRKKAYTASSSALPPKEKEGQLLSQIERLQLRHDKAAAASKKDEEKETVMTLPQTPSPTPATPSASKAKIAVTPKTTPSKEDLRSTPVPSSPSKPAPTLPKSPIPSSPTTMIPSTTLVATRSSRRNQKSSEERGTPSSAPSPLHSNGVDHVETPPARRSTRDRKPSLKIQQRELPLDQYLPAPSSRKNSKAPGPTPEPPEEREPFAIPIDPSSIPLLLPNGLSPIKEDMPLLSPALIKPSTRRQTRNSLDAASLPPVLQVQQVLLQEQQAQQLQQKQDPLPPASPSPVVTRSRRGTFSTPKDSIESLLITSPKESNGKDEEESKESEEREETPVINPKKIPNGLMSPMTRRRSSLQEKEKSNEENEVQFLDVVTVENLPLVIMKDLPMNRKKTEVASKRKSQRKIPEKPICLCLEKLEELKKSGKRLCMKQLDKWIRKKGMVVKVRFMPRTAIPKRERRVEILEKCLHSIITPSPTRYMLSEEEKKKMEVEMVQKDIPIASKNEKKRETKLRRADIKREQRAKQWVSAIWYNLKQAERNIRRKIRKEEEKKVCVMVEREEGRKGVKVMVMKRKECERKKRVKRISGWKKISKKEKTVKKEECKSEKKKPSKSVSKDKEIQNEVEKKKEGKKEKKVEEPSTIHFKGRRPKLIEGEEQWKEFVKVCEKDEGDEEKTEKSKKSGKSAAKKNKKVPNGKTKRVEEEVGGEVMDVVIKIGKTKDKKKGRRTTKNEKRPNGMKMKGKRITMKQLSTSSQTVSKKMESERMRNCGKRKESKLTLEQIRNRYLIAPEERLAAATEEKRKKGRGQLVKIIRRVLSIANSEAQNKQMKILRALAKHKRKNENEGPLVIPPIDLSVPPFNEKRPGEGWPVEWAIPKPLRAPGVYRRRKLRAVRRAERRREKQKMEKERRERAAKRAAGILPLRPMPWTKTSKGRKERPEGKIGVLSSIAKGCAMKENGDTAKAVCEMKAKAREKVMDVIFDTVFSGGKIRTRDESATILENEEEKTRVEEKSEEKKEEKSRRASIRGKKDLMMGEQVSDGEKEEEMEVEDEEMNETLAFGDNEEEEADVSLGGTRVVKVKRTKKPKKPKVKIEPTSLCKNEVAIELAVAQREYQRELDNYARMLTDIFYILGAREHQIRARKNLEEKEDALAHLHAKFYREVPRRLPNEQEMEQIAKALSDRREAMEEAFGANLWRQPRIQPEHPAWLTAEYNPGAKRQDKYNYFVDWDYDKKREIMRAHEKMWAAATSHHLPSGEGYGKYDVGVNREMEGEEKTLFEWEKNLVGALIVGRRKQQMRVEDAHNPRLHSLPKRPPTEASLKKKAEMEKKREKEEKEEK